MRSVSPVIHFELSEAKNTVDGPKEAPNDYFKYLDLTPSRALASRASPKTRWQQRLPAKIAAT